MESLSEESNGPIWDKQVPTKEQIENVKTTWQKEILPITEDFYTFLYTLSKDPEISKEFEILEQNQVYQIHWQPQFTKKLTYKDFNNFISQLSSQNTPIDSLKISESEFNDYHEIVSNYDINIDLTLAKDNKHIQNLGINLSPKKTILADDRDFSANYTLVFQVENIHYNESLDLIKPKDGEFLYKNKQKSPSTDEKEAFKTKAKAFIDTHKDAPKEVTKEVFEKAFDLTLVDDYTFKLDDNNQIFAYDFDDEFFYSVSYEHTNEQTFTEFQELYEALAYEPTLLKDSQSLIKEFNIPDEANVIHLTPHGYGKTYENGDNMLVLSKNEDDKTMIYIATPFIGDISGLSQETFETTKRELKFIEDALDKFGSFNGVRNNYDNPSHIEYVWSDKKRESGNVLSITTNFEGNIIESSFYSNSNY